jgi:putative glutamine amidotransferase
MRAPLVGITGRGFRGHQIPGVPSNLATASIDMHFRDYADAVAEAGGIPVQLSLSARPDLLVPRLDALVLSGGADIDPRRYGAAPGQGLGQIDEERDEFELAVLDLALEQHIPVLGICRGMQLVNVALGGTLTQDIGGDSALLPHEFMFGNPDYTVHDVDLVPGSLAAGIYGARYRTTSAHHQAVDVVGAGLVVSGSTSDGVVETLEHRSLPVLGVQWHAERHQGADPAFGWLVEATRRRSAPLTYVELQGKGA